MVVMMPIVQFVQAVIDPREQMQILRLLRVRTVAGAVQLDHLVRVRI